MNPVPFDPTSTARPLNRLASEPSPYLLQHQFNPVDWYPWGDEAFSRARRERRPIFLSIGYSTCHWCHVMERESFEDPATAERLNRSFVSIKVDREERPDVDRIYMSYVQAISGQGGWPLNVFLTPDLKPFFGGTYFPPERRHGRIGFGELLDQIAALWTQRPNDIQHAADSTCEKLAAALQSAGSPPACLPEIQVLHQAMARFKEEYDTEHGGFGHAPKFPRPSQPRFLLSQAHSRGDSAARQMVIHTCNAMADGGIHDHVGGGFARYAVDAEWIVPHFEKMLYDNAQLLDLYVDVYQATGEQRHAQVARGIVHYVLRDLTHPQGGFFSAEDADSEGKEGRFYCWTQAELEAALSPEAFEIVRRRFGVSPQGNFVDHSDPEPLPGQNVLHIADDRLNDSECAILEAALQTLLAIRSRRPRPHLDDKVLTSWNGLMLGALARASRALREPAWIDHACCNAAFLHTQLWDHSTSTLYHRWRDGQRDKVQLLETYAFLLGGMLDLYEATLDPRHLDFAIKLGEQLIARFQDRESGGFWQSQPGDPHLILQLKEDVDGALPSGNASAILGLLRLSHITGRIDLSQAADLALRSLSPRATHLPQAVPFLLTALDFALSPPTRIVIHGQPDDPRTLSLLQVVHDLYLPARVILGTLGPVDAAAQALAQSVSPAAQVCLGTTCLPLVHEPEALRAIWRAGSSRGSGSPQPID